MHPRRLIIAAWAVFGLSAVFGTVGLIRTITGPEPTPLPTLGAPFQSGHDSTVTLDPGLRPALYAWAEQRISFRCTVKDGDGRSYPLTGPPGRDRIIDGKRYWELVYDIGVTAAGDYTVRCRAPEGYQAMFRVGPDRTMPPSEAAGQTAGNVLASFAVPVAGFVFALIVTVVVVKRGNRARRTEPPATEKH
ncbi:MAG TPA: hypothetical protein VIR33_08520 [Thermopolyspora sp.]